MITYKPVWNFSVVFVITLLVAVGWRFWHDENAFGSAGVAVPLSNAVVGSGSIQAVSDGQRRNGVGEPRLLRDSLEDGTSDSDGPAEQDVRDAPRARQFFSAPDYGSKEYREAYDLATAFLASYGESWSRNMVVRTDVDSIREFQRQVESGTTGLDGSFEISPFSDMPCAVTSVQARWPRFTPGIDEAPQRYQVNVTCADSRMTAILSFVQPENAFQIAIGSPVWGVFVVRSLGDWEYSLAFRADNASQRPTEPPENFQR